MGDQDRGDGRGAHDCKDDDSAHGRLPSHAWRGTRRVDGFLEQDPPLRTGLVAATIDQQPHHLGTEAPPEPGRVGQQHDPVEADREGAHHAPPGRRPS
jgi:hypothetical protein